MLLTQWFYFFYRFFALFFLKLANLMSALYSIVLQQVQKCSSSILCCMLCSSSSYCLSSSLCLSVSFFLVRPLKSSGQHQWADLHCSVEARRSRGCKKEICPDMTEMWAFHWSLKLKNNLITQWRHHTVPLESMEWQRYCSHSADIQKATFSYCCRTSASDD